MPTARMTRSPVVLVAALLAASLTAPARAQSPAERVSLDSLRRALGEVADSAALLVREQGRIAVARQNREDPLLHMELGLIAYRLGELTEQKQHYDDAAGEFEWAAELRPQWPYAWYLLGLAELAQGEASFIPLENIRQVLGTDALSKAARAFARAAEADPTYISALVDLGTVALRQRIGPRLAVAQHALRLAAATEAGNAPLVLLTRGRVERELGENDSALAAFRAYLARGGDSVLGQLEMARCLFAVGQADSAVRRYFSAARQPASDSARAEFRREVRWVATPRELQAFDEATGDSLAPWLTRFWNRRDLADARRPGERLIEQFRRYAYARQQFRLLSRHRKYDITDVYRDSTQSEFDDRGVIYLRHGEPDERVQYTDTAVPPNETWVYRRPPPTGELIFHFVARSAVQDWKLIGSLLDVQGFGSGLGLAAPSDDPALPRFGRSVVVGRDNPAQLTALMGLLASRATISPLYERMYHAGTVGRGRLVAEERTSTSRAVAVGTTTDSYPIRFDRDLRPVVTSFAMAGRGGRGELHVVFAIPVSALQSFNVATGGTAYPLRLRVVVFDTLSRALGGVDTLRVFRSAAPLPSGSYLTEQLVVGVPTGPLRFHFVAEEVNADAGAMVSGEAVDAPSTERGLAASDLVLGRTGSGLVWRRPDGDVPLNPLMRFPRDGSLELYYELYGMPASAGVATRVAVIPAGGRPLLSRIFGRRGGARLEYTTQMDAPGFSRVRQRIDLGGLAPGRYVLEVELRDPGSGARVVRRQTFDILGQRAP
jgi:GWxTD domain-containing protein